MNDTDNGAVLEAKSLRLPTRSRAEDNSTREESATIVQATVALRRLIRTGAVEFTEGEPEEARIVADSLGSVCAIRSQAMGNMKATERSKSALQSHFRRASECIDEESTFQVTVKHDLNEHNRLWNNPWRETLACRGNRACDFAAGVASKKWWRN